MINFIDEEKLVHRFINNKKMINNNTYTLLVAYTKYLKQSGISKAKIRDELDNLMYEYYNDFCMADFDTMLQKIVNKYSKADMCKYKKPRSINITQKELEYIRNKQDTNIEHLLFVLLALSKINYVDKDEFIISFDEGDIFKLAKYKYQQRSHPRIVQRNLKLNDLSQMGYIKFGQIFNSQTIKVLYATSEFDEDGINITITEETVGDMILYYHQWKGDIKIGTCSECGKPFEIKSNSQNYCNECKKIKELERHTRYNQKR